MLLYDQVIDMSVLTTFRFVEQRTKFSYYTKKITFVKSRKIPNDLMKVVRRYMCMSTHRHRIYLG